MATVGPPKVGFLRAPIRAAGAPIGKRAMSTLGSGAKVKMTGLLKAAFRWLRDEPPSQPPQSAAASPTTTNPKAWSKSVTPSPGSPASTPAQRQAASNGETLRLPLQPILEGLPAELQAKLRQQNVGALTIALPLFRIMAQLPQGAVKISFGELRLAAPGVFLLTTDCDHVPVSLPLGDILSRINLAKLPRHTEQKVVEVPEDVTSPFGEKGKGLAISDTKGTPSVGGHSARASTHVPPPHATPPAPVQRGITPAPPAPLAAPPRSVTPSAPAQPEAPTPPPKPATPWASLLSRAATHVTAAVSPHAPGGNGGGEHPQHPTGAHGLESPSSPAAHGNPPGAKIEAAGGAVLEIPLGTLMKGWPEAVQLEIVKMDFLNAKVQVPMQLVEKALRQGKVSFPWRLVRAWIRPAVSSQPSNTDATPLELPLSLVTPLFLAQRQLTSSGRRKLTVDETIPNLFFGFPQPEAASDPSVAAPADPVTSSTTHDTNLYFAQDAQRKEPLAQQTTAAAPSAPGPELLSPPATPNEILSRALALEGVAGALVALADGLTVASRVPPNYNSDTLAAFLAQIFTKVSHCTQELRMGGLNNLSFTVGNVPWKVFRVNNVFFAAFGREEHPLPTAQLASLAAELDHKSKAT